jgi:hypothetical protein
MVSTANSPKVQSKETVDVFADPPPGARTEGSIVCAFDETAQKIIRTVKKLFLIRKLS